MASDETPGRSKPTLSIIVPTYQEATNVPILFERIKQALDGKPWELIVVDDDSPDGTSDVAFALAAEDRRIALPETGQSLRSRGRSHRGVDVIERRLCCGHRRRSSARRIHPARDVRRARQGPGRLGRWNAAEGCGRRRRPFAGATGVEQSRRMGVPGDLRGPRSRTR